MHKKITAGETIGYAVNASKINWRGKLISSINRAINRAVKAERKKIHDLAADLSGIKDQKLPQTFAPKSQLVKAKKPKSAMGWYAHNYDKLRSGKKLVKVKRGK